MSIEGQGHFLTIYFPGFVCTRPRYQVSVYRTIGPLVIDANIIRNKEITMFEYIFKMVTMDPAILEAL